MKLLERATLNIRIWMVEAMGTFALVFAGIASIAARGTALEIAFTFGLTVAVMIAAVGPISLAHFNPAVSIGFWLMRRIGFKTVLLYWSAELFGAILAGLGLRALYSQDRLESIHYGATLLSQDVTRLQGFGVKFVLSFLLMFVIATCVMQQQALSGIYIGFTVSLCAIAGGASTGASLNPARSFAPALFSGLWSQHWLYWLALMLGAALAAAMAIYIWQEKS